jgi:DNA adenine methylase
MDAEGMDINLQGRFFLQQLDDSADLKLTKYKLKTTEDSSLSQSPIKWPGGKAKEYQYIKHLIPVFDRYFEPFFGGGAIYFKLQPAKAVINDFSSDLIEFFRFLKGENDHESFLREMLHYVENWEKIPDYIKLFDNQFIDLYHQFKQDKITFEQLKENVAQYLEEHEQNFNGLFEAGFCLDHKNLVRRITENLISKIRRTKKIETTRGEMLEGDLEKNIETAFRSGFYMHFRDLMNGRIKGKVSTAKMTANYYFIREFCYGSMFRFNAKGEFNIPYGGVAYNSKDFRKKVERMLTDDFKQLFANTVIEVGDFEEALKKHQPTSDDFIFLDPPYDSDFSDYDNQEFGPKDQTRLANYLYTTPAKYLMLIKETPFIRSLYENKPGITIESFEKQYLYNVKGRNNQDARHLIVYNYKP